MSRLRFLSPSPARRAGPTRSAISSAAIATRGGRAARRPRESRPSRARTSCSTRCMSRATSDVYTLITQTELGRYPYAGIPWFSTIFGRDGIITAMLMLWVDPQIARGRAAHAGRDAGDRVRREGRRAARKDPARDAPRRDGQSRRGAVRPLLRHGRCHAALPHAGGHVFRTHRRPRYDPVHLAEHRGGAALDRPVWRRATATASVEYYRETDTGLANQGWKDSHDAIFHRGRIGARRARSRSAKCRAMSMPPSMPSARIAAELGHGSSRRGCSRRRSALRLQLRAGVLVRGDRHLRAGARWREAAMPRPQLECRPRPLHRHRRSRSRARASRRR